MLGRKTKKLVYRLIFVFLVVVTVIMPIWFSFNERKPEGLQVESNNEDDSEDETHISKIIEKIEEERIRSDDRLKRRIKDMQNDINLKHSDEKGIKKKLNKEKHQLNLQKMLCEIPRLNPFDELAMKQMKNVPPLKCSRQYFSNLKNGYLSIKVKDVYDVYIQYIQRPFQNDFEVEYSKKISFSKKYEISKLAKGKVGCIVNNKNEILVIQSKIKGQKHQNLYVTSKVNCSHEHFWFLSTNGRIENYLTNLCINQNRSTKSKEFIATKCSESKLRFDFHEDGIIKDNSKSYLITSKDNKIFAAANVTDKLRWSLLGSTLQNINIKHKVNDDFVKVSIVKDKKVHEEYHAQVIEKEELIKKAKKSSAKANLPYNVAFFLIDSQSNSNVQRKMPKTYETLKNDKNTIIFNGHTIVGDGTTPQLCAIFVGELEENLPEGRRGFKDGQPIDRWPFLFKDFKERGYLTLFSEDEPMYGSFNYRLHGFKDKPTDHYARPFWMAAHVDYYWEGECVGDTPVFQKNIDYSIRFHDSYKGIPKLSLTAISTISHNDVNRIQNADNGVSDIINRMKQNGNLNDTIIVIFGDHGARLSGFRETMVGKLEERLPFLSITLPSDLISKYANLVPAMKHNSNILTSHFDIHATLKHMFTYPEAPAVKKGQSLFKIINATERDCKSAGIKEHWCPCLQFKVLNTSDELVVKSANKAVEYINKNITHAISEGRERCALLKLDSIKRAGERIPNKLVRTFKETSANEKCVECDLVLGDDNYKSSIILELVFSVSPSGGIFEASVTINANSITVNPNISRINKYGNQPKCIQDKYPFLRKYCFCK